MNTPEPGDIGCVAIRGPVGLGIRIGQWALGEGWRNFEHAFICVGFTEDGHPRIVEAMPWGARYGDATTYRPALWSTGSVPLTDAQRQAIVAAAESYIGTPYGFLTYLAIATHRFHVPVPGLRRIIASTRQMICSQLVAQAYQDAGIQLFPGAWDGYVTPAMLANLIEARRPQSARANA